MIRRGFRGAFGDDEIDDIYSNAWVGTLRALERRHNALGDEEIRRYVLTAVAHHASKELRRRDRRPTAPLEAVDAVAGDDLPPHEHAAKLEDSRITRDLLASLPPRRRAVMLLRYGWGLEPRQVCRLVKGLSPRAYRKEITRGIDELTEKLRLLERGEWCADREPVLKSYAAGIADEEQQRQAQRHLSHCRHCTDFVSRLSGHLHDLGGSIAVPGAIDAVGDNRLSLPERLGDLAHRVRDSASHPLARGGDDTVQEVATQASAIPGGARGAGAAGGGILAKVSGLGAAGKIAAVCLGGGAAATACVAAGVITPHLPGGKVGADRRASARPAVEQPHPVPVRRETPAEVPATGHEGGPATAPAPSGDDLAGDAAPAPAPAPTPGPQPAPTPVPAPVEASAPPEQQEFGVASAAAPSDSGGSPSSGGGSSVKREFGP
jgi:RNA polymerase sigma factor (sigma-70 family)